MMARKKAVKKATAKKAVKKKPAPAPVLPADEIQPSRAVHYYLRQLAELLEEHMVSIGLDPRDMNQVSVYVDGCSLTQLLKVIIVEDLDQE